jgi:hypothetical protein
LLIEGSGSGSVSLTNGSGADPGGPKTNGSYGSGFESAPTLYPLASIS